MEKDVIIRLSHISKSFPGVKALDDITLEICRGSVHALVGENGAGKSTLIKILSGIYQMDNGEITLEGKKVRFPAPIDSQKAGISVIHQELKLSEPLTVTENIFLGNWMRTSRGKLVDWKKMRKTAVEQLHDLGIDLDPDAIVSTLSVAKRQIIEICKAISRDAKIIIMDEPSASLTDRELTVLFRTVKKLKSTGYTVIYISHRMSEVFFLADTVSVLRDGRHIRTLPIEDVTRGKLIELMVGRELGDEYVYHNQPVSTDIILEARHLTRNDVIKDVSFSVRRGEVLGFSGLVGAGRTEVARALIGIDKVDAGDILYKGKIVKWNFRQAIEQGIGFVPEDRKRQGLALEFSVMHNVTIVALNKVVHKGIISFKKEEQYTNEYIHKLNIATPSVDTEVQSLSGGNQQKVVIGKWLMRDSEVLILDEPTRGVDVGAKHEIYLIIKELVEQGKTLIVISSEMSELIGICDRILVMCRGKIVGEFSHNDATQDKILSLCV